jgi:SAM-dependent methyltransferase
MTPDWDQCYRERRTPWDRGAVNPALLDWLDRGVLAPPGRVLVPGCGRGHEAIEFCRRGFSVTALDLAPSALSHLRAQLAHLGLRAELIQADVLHWRPETAFDAVYEQTCLCALPPEHWPRYARQLRHWLVPGGRLLALFMQTGRGGGPPFHCALPEMRTLFPESLWLWPEDPDTRVPHPSGMHELAFCLARA